MPVAKANGKNAMNIVSVSQLGMRSDRASLAPAKIMRSGKTEIERKFIMCPQAIFAQPKIALTSILTCLA